MAVLAIDPGIVVAAYCVFDDNGVPIEFGDIKFNTKRTQEQRFWEFFSKLKELSERHVFTQIIAESQFVNIMSQIVGMIMAFSGSVDVKLIKYVPSQWKLAATGAGNIKEDELRKFIENKYSSLSGVSEHVIDCAGMHLAYLKKTEDLKNGIKPVKKQKKKGKVIDATSTNASTKKKKSS